MDTIKINNKRNTLIIAHRGLSGMQTENTAQAFEAACKRSYYGVECDVHVTSDGKYVIFHDDSTGRLCTENLIIEQTPFDTLRNLNYKDGVSKMATLEEYLHIIAKYNKVCVIELKNHMPEKNIAEIINICKQVYMLEKIIFISFDFENLSVVRKLLPKQCIQFLTDKLYDGTIEKLIQNNFGIDIGFWAFSDEIIAQLQKENIIINCWTCDERESAQKLIDAGVNFITTNILE